MKKIISCMVLMFFISPVFSQDGNKDQDKKLDNDKVVQQIYSEEVLEDFESTSYTPDKNLKFDITNQQVADLQIRDQFPAQYDNSKKYLGVKCFGRLGDIFRIIPAKELVIKKYCKSINVWVYGKNFSGELQFVVQDVEGTVHNISFGKLTFNGWRKLTTRIKSKVKQQNEYLEQEKTFRILYILYKPSNDTQVPIWQYFYLDDITATVRDKYKDNQSDSWGIGFENKNEGSK
ncbi:MAG TPA: flagellar filament outer layer protein FlaA [Spirochaetota bacterium]|nr:flagellar filament outer layer protein FlaA [Spirochaetota bacterium]